MAVPPLPISFSAVILMSFSTSDGFTTIQSVHLEIASRTRLLQLRVVPMLRIFEGHGNVWEWTNDSGRFGGRVVRGGCWKDGAGDCRSAFWSSCGELGRDNCSVGFRLLRKEKK